MEKPVLKLTPILFAGLLLGLTPTAGAQQHAHVHGQAELTVAIDAGAITLQFDSPLDNLLGFERQPRTQAERNRVRAMARDLQAADRWFVPDPSAGCEPGQVTLESPVLSQAPSANRPGANADDHKHEHKHGHGHKHEHEHASADPGKDAAAHGHDHAHDDAHMELAMTVVFNCRQGDAARFIDVKLFDGFKRIERIDAAVASGRGQARRTLTPASPRLVWGQ